MKKLSESVYVGRSVLELSKMIMYEFWYYYVTPKYGEKSKIVLHGYRQFHCIHKKTGDIYKDIPEDVETRFVTSNYELDRSLLKRKKVLKMH